MPAQACTFEIAAMAESTGLTTGGGAARLLRPQRQSFGAAHGHCPVCTSVPVPVYGPPSALLKPHRRPRMTYLSAGYCTLCQTPSDHERRFTMFPFGSLICMPNDAGERKSGVVSLQSTLRRSDQPRNLTDERDVRLRRAGIVTY
ncbi:hypothetical protein [Amycolatopsis sp. AA4]|uniref:hypothetical protein n=1 Tax=Amycolatopsis sp. AA4 TaxID=1896961 RepID=UPI001319BD95|nr:hypothetical protein [Amycolatopsis sp. AA4]